MNVVTSHAPVGVKRIGSRSLLRLLLLLLFVSCATDGRQPQSAGPSVSPDPPAADQTLLFFYTQRRDSLRNEPTIHVDDTKVFTFHGDAHSWCYVKPGFHRVSAIWDPYRSGLNMQKQFIFTPGATIYLRLTTDTSGNGRNRITTIQMHPMDPVIAKLDTERSTYTAPLVTKVDSP
jgi:hypothetical protein